VWPNCLVRGNSSRGGVARWPSVESYRAIHQKAPDSAARSLSNSLEDGHQNTARTARERLIHACNKHYAFGSLDSRFACSPSFFQPGALSRKRDTSLPPLLPPTPTYDSHPESFTAPSSCIIYLATLHSVILLFHLRTFSQLRLVAALPRSLDRDRLTKDRPSATVIQRPQLST